MIRSAECIPCDARWPVGWGHCPACGQRTRTTTLTPNRDASEAKHAKFERLYAERERKRTGPTPEEIGHAEAQRIIELERGFAA